MSLNSIQNQMGQRAAKMAQMAKRATNPQDIQSIQRHLVNGVQNGSIPAYIGVPLMQELTQKLNEAKAQTAMGTMGGEAPMQNSPPIAQQVMQQAEQESAGLESLPSNLPEEYAGGGIIAFEGGGEVPGYAGPDGSFIVDPSVQRDRDYGSGGRRDILLQELEEEQDRAAKGYPGAQENVVMLQREISRMKPVGQVTNKIRGGLESLVPAAQASNTALPVAAPADEERSSTLGNLFKGVNDFMTGGKKGQESLAEIKRQYKRDLEGAQVIPGLLEQLTPTQRADREAKAAALFKRENPAGITSLVTPQEKPATGPATDTVKNAFAPQDAPPPVDTRSKTRSSPRSTPRSTRSSSPRRERPQVNPTAEMMGRFNVEGFPIPKEKSLQDVIAEQAEADKSMGVDADIFNKIREDYKSTAGNFAKKKDQAFNSALMMFGLNLAGARRGREFQKLGEAGTQALNMYSNAMEKLDNNEEKLRQASRELSLAENQFRMGRSDKALSKLQSVSDKRDGILLKNLEMQNQAKVKAAEVAAAYQIGQLPGAQQSMVNDLYKSMKEDDPKATKLDAYRATFGVAKTGGLTLNQALEAVQRNPRFMGKTPQEQMAEAQKMVNEKPSGAGSNVLTYVPGQGLK